MCLGESSPDEPLIYPCHCPRPVHAPCLARWQLHSAGGRCAHACAVPELDVLVILSPYPRDWRTGSCTLQAASARKQACAVPMLVFMIDWVSLSQRVEALSLALHAGSIACSDTCAAPLRAARFCHPDLILS